MYFHIYYQCCTPEGGITKEILLSLLLPTYQSPPYLILSQSPIYPPGQDKPDSVAIHDQLKTIIADTRTADVLSINGLLTYLQSAERTAAPQPDGLTVKMHGYQLQSLQFMLDAEARVGGFR